MKTMTIALLALFGVLQYKLWVGEGSISTVMQLNSLIQQHAEILTQWQARNNALEAEVKDLKQGTQAAEELARSQLGMIKQGEVLYQILEEQV